MCASGGKEIQVYPHSFSNEVPECDEHLCLIREYRHEDSLLKLILESKSQKKVVKWTDVNGAIAPMALFHINTPWITERTHLLKPDEKYFALNAFKHLERLAFASSGKGIEKQLEIPIWNMPMIDDIWQSIKSVAEKIK